MFDVLNNITGYLTEITVPTKLECEKSMVEWATAMLSCFEKLQISKVNAIHFMYLTQPFLIPEFV